MMNEIGIRPSLAAGKYGTLDSLVQKIIKDGYCKFSVDDDIYNLVLKFTDSVRNCDLEYKFSHASPQHSDGFMGAGSEFSNINGYADIREFATGPHESIAMLWTRMRKFILKITITH